MNIYDDDALFQDYIFIVKQIVQINFNQCIKLSALLCNLKIAICLASAKPSSVLIHKEYHW